MNFLEEYLFQSRRSGDWNLSEPMRFEVGYVREPMEFEGGNLCETLKFEGGWVSV